MSSRVGEKGRRTCTQKFSDFELIKNFFFEIDTRAREKLVLFLALGCKALLQYIFY